MLIDKVIKGEKAFEVFMDKFDPQWRDYSRYENCWQLGIVHVERFYEKGPDDDCYKEWFWLTMPSTNGKGFSEGKYSNRRQEIYEGIRTGKILG